MLAAVDEASAELPDPDRREPVAEALRGYFLPAAEQMRNDETPERPGPTAPEAQQPGGLTIRVPLTRRDR
jgi:hypothetical protein